MVNEIHFPGNEIFVFQIIDNQCVVIVKMRSKTYRNPWLLFKKAAMVLVALMAMVPITMSAYDFKEGGIYYDVNGTQVTVTREGDNTASYAGDVVIPETVTHNGVEYTVTAIGYSSFSYCHNLTSIEIPNTIVSIEHHAFRSCEKLQSVVIPNSVTNLGRCVFHSCSGLKSAVIGNSVPVIDEYCFQYCSQLTDVVLGSSVTRLETKAFFDCYALKDVSCLAPTPPTMIAWYSFDGSNYGNVTVHVLGSSMEAYKADEYWGQFSKYASLTKATSLSLDQSMVTLNGGEQAQLNAIVEPADASSSVNWTSSDTRVAAVDAKGVVTAIGAGEAIITATTLDGTDLTAQCVVRVYSTSVQHANVLSMPATLDVENGMGCVLPVEMRNVAGISAVQCDITLPEGVELAQEDGEFLIDVNKDRLADSHVKLIRQLSSGAVRVLITSPIAEAINGNDGELFALHLDVAAEAEDGVYPVRLSNVVMAGVDAMTYYAPDVTSSLVVKSYVKGDANGDGMVNVGDYVTIANYILEMNPEPFIFRAADVDDNQEINVGDLVGVTNIVMGIEEVPEEPENPDADPVRLSGSVTSDGGMSTVTFDMSNTVELTALQMDVTIPAGMTLGSARLTSRGSMSHALKVVELGNGKMRLLASSSMNDVLGGNEGALLTLALDGQASGDAVLDVDNIMAAEQDMTIHAVKPFKVNAEGSGVREIMSDVRIYTQDENIVVETTAETPVEIIMTNGMSRTVMAKAGVNTYPVERGICIVRAVGQVAKLKL